MEVTISKSNYTFVDVSNWLDQLDRVYTNAKVSMWHFAATLAAGIDQFGRTDPRRQELFELASQQLGLAVSTLKTYASAARSPVASLAIEKDLTFQHARAVLGLPPDVADDLLDQAVANGWSAERLSQRAWAERNVPPQRTLTSQAQAYPAIEFAHRKGNHDAYSTEPDDVPFSHATTDDDCATYDSLWTDERIDAMVDKHADSTDDYIAVDGELRRVQVVNADDVKRLLRTMRDEYEIVIGRQRP